MRNLDADFGVRILRGFGCGFFRGFCDGLCGFWVWIFFADFFGCFPVEKNLKNPIKKSHRKILTKDLVRETFLHNTPPHSFWQDKWFSAQMASVREDERVISTCV